MSGSELIRYAMWSVFRVADRAALSAAGRPPAGWEASPGSAVREALAAELTELFDQAAGMGTVTRGCYNIQGLRAGADYMFWWLAPAPGDLQEIYARFRRTRLGRASEPVWSAMALHEPAEFSQDHIPVYLAGDKPRAYLSVYPYLRSYEWYLLDPAERSAMLAEHGMMARQYPAVQCSTVACFSLNHHEWIMALEADDLPQIVDLMWHLRGARARRHTRAEIPFFTGRRKPVRELVAALS